MQYLTHWRMHLAARRLRVGRQVVEVALDVGYGSEAAFSRAFKRVDGVAPATWRRARRAMGTGETAPDSEPLQTRAPRHPP